MQDSDEYDAVNECSWEKEGILVVARKKEDYNI